MVNDAARLAGVIGVALKAELEGNSFYLMAAQAAQDPKAKEVFSQFAAEEMMHAETLRKLYDSAVNAGSLDSGVSLPRAPLRPEGGSPIFSPSFKERLAEAHFEVTALSIGIQLEKEAMEFYRAEAEASGDPVLHDLFLELSEWEKGHFEALSAQLEEVKEDYWHANRFTPF